LFIIGFGQPSGIGHVEPWALGARCARAAGDRPFFEEHRSPICLQRTCILEDSYGSAERYLTWGFVCINTLEKTAFCRYFVYSAWSASWQCPQSASCRPTDREMEVPAFALQGPYGPDR